MRNYEEQVKEYMEQMKKQIEEYDFNDYIEEDQDQEDLYEKLYSDMWADDNITGNGSTRGYFDGDQEEARDMMYNAPDVLREAVQDFCDEKRAFDAFLKQNFIWLDTTIRCYLLHQALTEVLKEKGLYE